MKQQDWPIVLMMALTLIIASCFRPAHADNLVMACPAGHWGTSTYCTNDAPTGCNDVPVWKAPGPDVSVRAQNESSSQWPLMKSLAASDSLEISSIATAGSPAKCSQITGKAAVSDLLGSTPPTEPTPPPTQNPMPCGYGCFTDNWTAPTQNTDGTPAHITNYRLSWTGPQSGSTLTGNVLTYTVTGLAAGTYSVVLTALDATSESDPTPAASVAVTAAPVTPPDTTPPTATVVTEVLGTYTLRKGTTNIQTGLPTYEACKEAALSRALSVPTKYNCITVGNSIVVVK